MFNCGLNVFSLSESYTNYWVSLSTCSWFRFPSKYSTTNRFCGLVDYVYLILSISFALSVKSLSYRHCASLLVFVLVTWGLKGHCCLIASSALLVFGFTRLLIVLSYNFAPKRRLNDSTKFNLISWSAARFPCCRKSYWIVINKSTFSDFFMNGLNRTFKTSDRTSSLT